MYYFSVLLVFEKWFEGVITLLRDIEISKNAKLASIKMSALNLETRNQALLNIADKLLENKNKIFEANQLDLKLAESLVTKGEITQSTFNRLKLDENKFRDMVKGVKDVALLPDPINKILLKRELDENLTLHKITCPIGVIGVIFEARPDVISQISALSIKSGNAIILKGGKEAQNTNKAIFETIKI